ncbi:nucleotidyltransferase domain-containing protein [Candidatus Woesearchaeota archaeon]|nr:nucleotidyltransferase domain-containing protein [Candidatus Woesearchaeota archaeon]
MRPGIHKRELSKQLKLGMPSIDYGIKKIEKLIKVKRSGNQLNFFLDYSKEALTPALCEVDFSRFEKIPKKIKLAINDFLFELKEKPLIAVLFGSYAKNSYSKESDIDIFIVFNKAYDLKEIEGVAKRISMRTNAKLNPVYLDYETFRESFHNNAKEFFKNLKKDKIILAGIEWWRLLEHEEA